MEAVGSRIHEQGNRQEAAGRNWNRGYGSISVDEQTRSAQRSEFDSDVVSAREEAEEVRVTGARSNVEGRCMGGIVTGFIASRILSYGFLDIGKKPFYRSFEIVSPLIVGMNRNRLKFEEAIRTFWRRDQPPFHSVKELAPIAR
jgi:hypothetical protein